MITVIKILINQNPEENEYICVKLIRKYLIKYWQIKII